MSTWRVQRQDWAAGHSLHRSPEDAYAFDIEYDAQNPKSTNRPRGNSYMVMVDKKTYEKVYSSRYGIWVQ